MAPLVELENLLWLFRKNDTTLNVFCVHAVDGGITPYFELAKTISSDFNVAGIYAPNFRMKGSISGSVNSIAHQYADQIGHATFRQPCILIGWSSGAWIALEVAHELYRRGVPVRGLIALDAGPPPKFYKLGMPQFATNIELNMQEKNSARIWWRFMSLYIPDAPTKFLPTTFWKMNDTQKSRLILEHAADESIFNLANPFRGLRKESDVIHLFNTINMHFNAFLCYNPSEFKGSAGVILAHKPTDDIRARENKHKNVEHYWRSCVSGTVYIKSIDGNHEDVLRYPNLLSIVSMLHNIINK